MEPSHWLKCTDASCIMYGPPLRSDSCRKSIGKFSSPLVCRIVDCRPGNVGEGVPGR